MKAIKEVIVVEGRHDTATLKKYFECETIETGGSAIDEHVLDRIRKAQQTRGVIVFTDPDSPGNRIRHIIEEAIPDCKHAFVPKKDARTDKKVGIEHADQAVLEEALNHVVTFTDTPTETLSLSDFYTLGLTGRPDSEKRRMKIALHYHIGYGTAKTMRKRLNGLSITADELREVLADDGI